MRTGTVEPEAGHAERFLVSRSAGAVRAPNRFTQVKAFSLELERLVQSMGDTHAVPVCWSYHLLDVACAASLQLDYPRSRAFLCAHAGGVHLVDEPLLLGAAVPFASGTGLVCPSAERTARQSSSGLNPPCLVHHLVQEEVRWWSTHRTQSLSKARGTRRAGPWWEGAGRGRRAPHRNSHKRAFRTHLFRLMLGCCGVLFRFRPRPTTSLTATSRGPLVCPTVLRGHRRALRAATARTRGIHTQVDQLRT